MSTLDPRRIRIGVEVSGSIRYYEGFKVRASGTKFADPTQNDCTVRITGLSRDTRDYLLTETSPFNKNRTPKRIIVEVGRVSSGLSTLFVGDITSAEPTSPPDIELTLKAKTASASANELVSRSAGALAQLSNIARGVATDLGLALIFEALDRQIPNYSHTGSALAQVERLRQVGGVSAFVDDSSLIVKDRLKALSGAVRELDLDSGLVGLPKATETGAKITFLVDGGATLGGTLRVRSKFNPPLSGDYRIEQLAFDVASHEDPFFYTAVGVRL